MSGLYPPDRGRVLLDGVDLTGETPSRVVAAGLARSFQITNLFPALSVEENLRLAVQARDASRFDGWSPASAVASVTDRTAELVGFLGLTGMEQAEAGALSYGGQRLLDMGLALASAPRVLLLDEPLAGLAAAERERVANLVKHISRDIPILLVEHDIDRVFALADRVTVMNEGRVLVDGTADDARNSSAVREVYIGAARRRPHGRHPCCRGAAAAAAHARRRRCVLRQEPHRAGRVAGPARARVHRVARPQWRRQVDAAEDDHRHRACGWRSHHPRQRRPDCPLPAATIARLGIGYVPQGRGLFAGMSVRDNFELGRLKRRSGSGTAWSDERILEFFPRLKSRLDTPADFLSGGEQQMVAVARALSGHVRVLLLDEPFEGLAPAVVDELFDAFDKLRNEVAMVIVEHNLDLVLALADRAYVLERGSVVYEGQASALRDDLELRQQRTVDVRP